MPFGVPYRIGDGGIWVGMILSWIFWILVVALVVVLLVAAGGLLVGHPSARTELEHAYERQIAGIARHKTIVAANARHFVMLDDPAFLTAAMEDFLGRVRIIHRPSPPAVVGA